MKRCGLYIWVSTDRQAKVKEGFLKNRDQLCSASRTSWLRGHLLTI